MGTKVQATPYLREYHSLIDLDASTNNAMSDKWVLENGKDPDLLSSHDREKMRQTILKHESIFRNQLQELHRLHGRQHELMNEIKRRGINKGDAKEEKRFLSPFPTENAERPWNFCHSSSSQMVAPMSGTSSKLVLNNKSSPNGTCNLGFPADSYFNKMEKRAQEKFSLFPTVESTCEKRNHEIACDRDNKFSLSALKFSIHNTTDGIPDRPGLSNSGPNLNFVTKAFFHDSLDSMNEEGTPRSRRGKEHPSDDYGVHFPEKKRIDKHSNVGNLFSGTSLAVPPSLLAEPRKEFSNCPSDICTSLSRKKKKIFGVEISGGSDDALDSASYMSSNLDQGARSHEENHPVPSLDSSSLIADSFVQNHVANWDDGKYERSKGGISSKKRLPCHSGIKTFFKNVDNTNQAADVLKRDPEHSRGMIPQRPMLSDCCQTNQENPKGSLPWFLRNSGVCADLNNGTTKSSYFMNLDSLQKFFGKAEMPYGTLILRKEVEIEIKEDKKIVDLPISDVLRENASKVNFSVVGDTCASKVEVDENASRNNLGTKDLVLDKGLNNSMSDLMHCIDLNLSLDDEDALSAPSFPSAIGKVAVNLEAPAAIDDASAEELDSRKLDALSGNTELPYQECDKIAADAMIAISLSVVDEFNSLKWFAEVISSGGSDNTSVVMDVSMEHSGASDEEGSIPDGMDYFEFMTLKLEDTKQQHHHHEPLALRSPSDDEAQTRRTRRGRQQRDFQRDILPGLVTLSRLEVSEDFHAFEELLKAGDSSWQSRLSHRRGRKRLGGATEAQQPVCQIEERSLAGWGKKTRRLPRQRRFFLFR